MNRQLVWTILGVGTIIIVAGCGNYSHTTNNSIKTPSIHQPTVLTKKNHSSSKQSAFFPYPADIFNGANDYAYAKEMYGTMATNFQATMLNGQSFSLSKWKGKDIVLEFAQTGCSACIASLPSITKWEANNKNIIFVPIFPLGTNQTVQSFYQNQNEPIDPHAIAGNGDNSLFMDYNTQYTPTFVFINKYGRIQLTSIGSLFNSEQMTQMTTLAFQATPQVK